MPKLEYCIVCDAETGKAGQGEDSLYDNNDVGPYCEVCFVAVKQEEYDQDEEA